MAIYGIISMTATYANKQDLEIVTRSIDKLWSDTKYIVNDLTIDIDKDTSYSNMGILKGADTDVIPCSMIGFVIFEDGFVGLAKFENNKLVKTYETRGQLAEIIPAVFHKELTIDKYNDMMTDFLSSEEDTSEHPIQEILDAMDTYVDNEMKKFRVDK